MERALSKNLSISSKLLILVWLAILASQIGISQRRANCELSIYGSLKIDVCGSENQKQFVLVMGVGNINRSDSLFGFNFQISYDNQKVKITDALYLSTLSEFFDTKAVKINSIEGKVNGYAITMGMQPIYGNRPLIAFNGYWLSQCPDTAIFSIDYIEFTDEFKISIDTLKPTNLIGEVKTVKDRVFELNVDKDTIISSGGKEEIDVKIRIPKGSKINDFAIRVNADFDKIRIDSVKTLGSDLKFEDYVIDDTGEHVFKILFSNINDSGNDNYIRFYVSYKMVNIFTSIQFIPEFESYCKCVNDVKSDSLITFCREEINQISFEDNETKIDGDCNIVIYDTMGRIVTSFRVDGKLRYERIQDFTSLANGIYYLLFFDKNLKLIKREIYVNY